MIDINYDNDIIYQIDVDFHSKSTLSTVYSKQYDTGSRYIVATVFKDGEEYTIPTNTVPMFCATKPSGKGVANTENCAIINNKIVYEVGYQTTVEHGSFLAEFRLSIPDDKGGFETLSSPRFKMYVEPSALDNETIISSDEVNVLDRLIDGARDVLESLRQLEIESGINEEQRKLNELERIANETQRETNEAERETSELDRETSEAQRKLDEEQRLLDEVQRLLDESERRDNELQREINESQRKLNEEQRQVSESAREVSELDRIASEEDRKEYYSNFKVWEDYNNEKPYVVGNKVQHMGSSYICVVDCQGVKPDLTTANWQMIVKRGEQGEQGIQGIQGEEGNNGVVTEINGNYAFQIIDDNLYIVYPDADADPPPFSIDEDGNLIVTIGE